MKNSTIVIADLNSENLFSAIPHDELTLIQGGWVPAAVTIAVAVYIIENWPDAKSGLIDGLQGK